MTMVEKVEKIKKENISEYKSKGHVKSYMEVSIDHIGKINGIPINNVATINGVPIIKKNINKKEEKM